MTSAHPQIMDINTNMNMNTNAIINTDTFTNTIPNPFSTSTIINSNFQGDLTGNSNIASRIDENTSQRHRIPFTRQEDDKIRSLVNTYGEKNWPLIASQIPNRTVRQCRERWQIFLKSDLKKGKWTEEEDLILKNKFSEIGPQWKNMEQFFSGRTSYNIRNRWISLTRNSAKNLPPIAPIPQSPLMPLSFSTPSAPSSAPSNPINPSTTPLMLSTPITLVIHSSPLIPLSPLSPCSIEITGINLINNSSNNNNNNFNLNINNNNFNININNDNNNDNEADNSNDNDNDNSNDSIYNTGNNVENEGINDIEKKKENNDIFDDLSIFGAVTDPFENEMLSLNFGEGSDYFGNYVNYLF